MIGVPVSDIVLALQTESEAMLKKTKGDMYLVICHVLSELQIRELVTADDKVHLERCYSDALDVLAGKKQAGDVVGDSRRRYARIVADHEATQVTRTLAELCHSVITRRAHDDGPSNASTLRASSTTTISNKGQQALFWGTMGALVGGAVGGGLGAVIGAAIGAALGACGDSDTTVTNTGGGN